MSIHVSRGLAWVFDALGMQVLVVIFSPGIARHSFSLRRATGQQTPPVKDSLTNCGAMPFVVLSPGLQFFLGLFQADEPVLVLTFQTHAPIE